jgi:hypothetical protein
MSTNKLSKLERELPPLRIPSDIVLPPPPSSPRDATPRPIECPYPDEDYNDVNEYDDLINH